MTRFNTAKDNLTEFQEQVKLAEYLDMKGYCWCHVPNGGSRKNAIEGYNLKRQGVKAGVPDILIFDVPEKMKNCCVGVVIELKRKKGGTLRESQEEWLSKLDKRDWTTNVCHGADEAIEFLENLFEGDK